MSFRYGEPSAPVRQLSPRPPCWGTSKYDNEDRECRGCGFQQTCRDEVMKSKPVAAPIPVSNYYNQFVPSQPYATPQAIVQQPVKTPTAPATQVVQVRPAQQPAVVQPASPVVRDRYGQFQDPMFTTIKSTPSVMRPQLPGEAFTQRVAKNMLLASAESAIGELLLGVRQFLWAPREDDEK
jgi:hypothetical protein